MSRSQWLWQTHPIPRWSILVIALVALRDLLHGLIPAWMGGSLILSAIFLVIWGWISTQPEDSP